MDPKSLLRLMFDTAVAAADPRYCLPRHLPDPPKGRTIVVGAGKASAAMALALEAHWPGPLQGAVVTRYGHGAPCRRIQVIEAAHPRPDAQSLTAARTLLELVADLTADDLVICLLSGGGSSLLCAPPPGVTLPEKQELTQALLRCGAPIDAINTVRKHLSLIKGGRLRHAAGPARMITLAISDVPGDDPAVIASGPTVQDQSTSEQALKILERHQIQTPPSVARWLADPQSQSPNLSACGPSDYVLVATPMMALQAAAGVARRHGVTPVVLGDDLQGEARDLGGAHALAALGLQQQLRADEAPHVLISGGETTVTLRGGGRGGRNSEYLLALAHALGGAPSIFALAADTDGIDGVEDNAGAIIGPDCLDEAARRGLDARASLEANDAYGFFHALDALVVSGPTLTNVNDFRAVLVAAAGAEP